MGYIAKGSITLDAVNDAYTVSLTKPSCVIHADFDGSNPILDDAWTRITVARGGNKVKFYCSKINEDSGVDVDITTEESGSCVALFSKIPTEQLEGSVDLLIKTDDGWNTTVKFAYTIVRESSMLDWIKDWEGSKTKIGGTYIMTPKLFIGKKESFADYSESSLPNGIMSIPDLTGVYIGPDSSSTGIYGYNKGKEIFSISESGGIIGGWSIKNDCLASNSGSLQLFGEGTIKSTVDDVVAWELNKDGGAVFASGKVSFSADGNAEFEGKITSTEGKIGGWNIKDTVLYSGKIGFDSHNNCIAISQSGPKINETDGSFDGDFLSWAKSDGGCAMYWLNDSDYGFASYNKNGNKIFSLGSVNKIGGWSFNDECIYLDAPYNIAGNFIPQYLSGIAIGTSGLRGTTWRIDIDGSAAFAGGIVKFRGDGNSQIAGWNITSGALYLGTNSNTSGSHAAENSIVLGSEGVRGCSWRFEKDGSGDLASGNIQWDAEGNVTLGENVTIAWIGNKLTQIDKDGAYIGNLTAGQIEALECNFTKGTIGSCEISDSAVYSQDTNGNVNWKLNADGSGLFAGGGIEWNSDGSVLDIVNARFYGLISKAPTIITKSNINKYLTYVGVNGNPVKFFDPRLCGSWIVFNGTGLDDNNSISIELNRLSRRSVIGASLYVYNFSDATIRLLNTNYGVITLAPMSFNSDGSFVETYPAYCAHLVLQTKFSSSAGDDATIKDAVDNNGNYFYESAQWTLVGYGRTPNSPSMVQDGSELFDDVYYYNTLTGE